MFVIELQMNIHSIGAFYWRHARLYDFKELKEFLIDFLDGSATLLS